MCVCCVCSCSCSCGDDFTGKSALAESVLHHCPSSPPPLVVWGTCLAVAVCTDRLETAAAAARGQAQATSGRLLTLVGHTSAAAADAAAWPLLIFRCLRHTRRCAVTSELVCVCVCIAEDHLEEWGGESGT